MALANFCDKAALAASQVLLGFDLDGFKEALASRTVALAFDKNAARSAEGRSSLKLAVALLARLYPNLAIWTNDRGGKSLRGELERYARDINSSIEIASNLQ